ncbi:alpha/beta hydrolase [Salegentibacter mishustinae]|uniref:Esterase n=1 Tax=Salegentibacter mishustinae TaxID=270918 RepID=A0A0Q9Z823_9FLAO|nr:esterase [Salegentibacter mishustinae]KRG29116.1 esterase [Salegentibacter mishustinae]PNW21831.1 esterase [Salegentibacter mishustinae]PZX65179.1 phospholipase/carboxylesterase [Salegentibacter mishustinae]GGW86843.1 esterase [Salegentibacter mishustinae]
MSTEKQLSYQITNTYSVLNNFTEKTKTVWLVCHGIGYLSRYFLRHFNHLNTEENYIIAPQAQSKYYLKNEYKHVGASWLTKERTEAETENVLNYLDEVYKAEDLKNAPRLIILGYSQGVSVATRWIAKRKINCDELIMHSGKVPAELERENFQFLKNTNFTFIYGTEDEYLKKGIIEVEEKRLKELFPNNFEIKTFNGGHEVNTEIIAEFT